MSLTLKKFIKSVNLYSFGVYGFATLFNLIISYFLILFLINNLTKQQFGSYGVYTSIFSLLIVFFNFGHKQLFFKWITKEKSFARIQLCVVSFTFLNVFLLCLLSITYLISIELFWIILSFILSSIMLTLSTVMRAKGRYVYDALIIPCQRSFWLVCLIYLNSSHQLTITAIFQTSSFSSLLFLVPLLVKSRTIFCLQSKFKGLGTKHIRLLWHFVVIELATIGYLKADVVVLDIMNINTSVIADYYFSIQVFDIAIMALMPIGYFFFKDVTTDRADIVASQAFRRYLLFGLFLVTPFLLGFLIFGSFFLETFTPQYVNAHLLVCFMLFTTVPVIVNILLSNYLISRNREVEYVKICLAALAFNLLGNFIFVFFFGVYASLVIKFMTEAFICGAMLVSTRLLIYGKVDY